MASGLYFDLPSPISSSNTRDACEVFDVVCLYPKVFNAAVASVRDADLADAPMSAAELLPQIAIVPPSPDIGCRWPKAFHFGLSL